MSPLKELRSAPWTEQIRNLITTPEQLSEFVALTAKERESIRRASALFPMAITPYYASLMDREDRRCPVRMQAVPTLQELSVSATDLHDPLGEESSSPVPGLTHRYPDRALLLATHRCAMFCRHCTRKRRVGDPGQSIDRQMLEQAIDYIARTPAVRDVLISGGDPLMLSDEALVWIISRVRAIKHVDIIRLGTRVPVVLPQRITPDLVASLRRFNPLWINTHFNHPAELTTESQEALARLADGGFPLGNQSVLLRNVNDCPSIQKELVHQLVRNRVRPYYLFQCDLARGIEHFRTPISRGVEISEMLRGHTSGLAVPTFVVDAPGGGGKIPVSPNYMITMGPRRVVLRNFEGALTVYNEPREQESSCREGCTHCQETPGNDERRDNRIGIGELLDRSPTISLVPVDSSPRATSRGGAADEHAQSRGDNRRRCMPCH